eukprot:3272370-Amphidinium_carterae.1
MLSALGLSGAHWEAVAAVTSRVPGGLTTILSSFLVPFFLFHCWLIARNSTTIEFCEKMRNQDAGASQESGAWGPASRLDHVLNHRLHALSLFEANLLWPCLWIAPHSAVK